VKLYGKGVILRQTLAGREIRTRPQFIASAGQLIMSRIDARNGAFGIVPKELDGSLVTQDFPLFDIDESVIKPEFLALLLRSEQFVAACKRASRGTTNRKRLREDLFLAETVPVPDLHIQRKIVELVRVAQSTVEDVLSAASTAEDTISAIANFVFE
jgi:restriction endonuclease S subunit